MDNANDQSTCITYFKIILNYKIATLRYVSAFLKHMHIQPLVIQIYTVAAHIHTSTYAHVATHIAITLQ